MRFHIGGDLDKEALRGAFEDLLQDLGEIEAAARKGKRRRRSSNMQGKDGETLGSAVRFNTMARSLNRLTTFAHSEDCLNFMDEVDLNALIPGIPSAPVRHRGIAGVACGANLDLEHFGVFSGP